MPNRSQDQRAARHLQHLTGWSYSECLRLSRESTTVAIEELAKMRGKAIDTNDPEYVQWKRRAMRLSAAEATARFPGGPAMSRPHPNGPRLGIEDTRTASDYRKTKAPKGAVGERQKQAYALHGAGASTKDLAAQYGVSVDTVRGWIQAARQEAIGQ